ncbi:hypothetical protein ADICEAN_04122 [Cesiribacter andamanensis AMV16]|uniref:Uncharacterized protein n=1 Tax=Cesiribacter andamanensis AMV16 TaxID=1279009 RepID=M7NQJ5_9BACT|nr:lysylphosphatidylglycerol synthase domain-containing protein [Cesiribacter andamanensis]EMR00759.1 hypothetical protein ADICEAN_04122 [Cesiribacter andamanensis AMV16]
MQVSSLSPLKKTSLAKKLTVAAKLLLFVGILLFLLAKLWQHEASWHSMLAQLARGWHSPANGWVGLALLLVPLNWLLEALKWQVLVRRIQAASLGSSCQAVLAGLSLGLLTPRSLGDYAGRLLVHGSQHKVRMLGVVLLNRLVQSLSTFLGGLLGILILIVTLGLWQSQELVWLLLPSLLGLLALLGLMGPLRQRLLLRLQQWVGEKWLRWLTPLTEYSVRELLLVNAWGLLRYGVFSFQFVCLLWWAGIVLPLGLLLAGVAATFLIKTLVPAFNLLSDLGVREFSALLIFSLLEQPQAEVVAASLLLWFLNICLPSLAGLGVVLQLRRKLALSE